MVLPDSVARGVERLLGEASGSQSAIRRAAPVVGGDINEACVVETTGGDKFFVKWRAQAPLGFFEVEVDGLVALRGAKSSLRVPEPLGCDRTQGHAWLAMEWIERGAPAPDYGERLAVGLAQLHQSEGCGGFGWGVDNLIGSLPQANGKMRSWGEFWRDRRIGPQLQRAWADGALARSSPWTELLDALAPAVERLATRPALLHGDLWSGNAFPDGQGHPVIVDPAVYVGDSDVDLSMAQLFGGFPSDFFSVYREIRFGSQASAIDSRTQGVRTAAHQLYPLLVHVNLFGGGYVHGAVRAAETLLDFATGG